MALSLGAVLSQSALQDWSGEGSRQASHFDMCSGGGEGLEILKPAHSHRGKKKKCWLE